MKQFSKGLLSMLLCLSLLLAQCNIPLQASVLNLDTPEEASTSLQIDGSQQNTNLTEEEVIIGPDQVTESQKETDKSVIAREEDAPESSALNPASDFADDTTDEDIDSIIDAPVVTNVEEEEKGFTLQANKGYFFEGHKYAVYSQSLTWPEAKKACEKLGGHLATIGSQDEQNFIQTILPISGKKQYWLGAQRSAGSFSWIDGTNFSYKNWDYGQPDNYRVRENYVQIFNEPCRYISRSQRFKWNDIAEDNTTNSNETDYFSLSNIGYICEWDDNPDCSVISQNLKKNEYAIFVVDSTGHFIENATVTWKWSSTQTQNTDSNGMAVFQRKTVESGRPVIKVSCSGYKDYSNEALDYQVNKNQYDIITLYKTTESDLSLTKATYKNLLIPVDVLNGVKELSMTNKSEKFNLYCDAVNPTKVSKYSIFQGNTEITSSKTGTFENLTISQFTAEEAVVIRVTGKDKKKVDTPINLMFKKDVKIKNTSFKIANGLTVKVGSDIPFLGDSELSFDFPLIPVEFYMDDNCTIHLGINTKIFDGVTDQERREKEFKELKDTIKKLNTIKGSKLGSELKNTIQKKMKKDLQPGWGKSKISASFIGYGEGKLNENLEGSVKAYLSIVISWSKSFQGPTTMVVVVPVTYNFKYSISGKLSVDAEMDFSNMTFNSDLMFEIKPGIEAFGGAGVGKFVGAGVYGSAELPVNFRLAGTSGNGGLESVDLSGELGLKAYAGPLTYQKSFAYKTWHLYSQANKAKLINSSQGGSALNASMFDASAYALDDLSYLEEESDWLGKRNSSMGKTLLSALSGNAENEDPNSLTPLLTDTYRNMQPVIGFAGNTPVMVWLRGNTSRGAFDTAQLVYSVYSNGSWSEAQPVDSSNVTCDAAPSLSTSSDGTLYLAYRNSSSVLASDSNITDYAAIQSIVTAKFNTGSRSFTSFSTVSKSGRYNYQPQMTCVNDIPTIVWASNTDSSDFFAQNSTNSLLYSQYKDGTWTSAKTIASGLNAIVSLSAGAVNTAFGVAAITDGDNDLSTQDDHNLTLYKPLAGSNVSVDDGLINYCGFAILPGNSSSKMLWTNDDTLYSYQTAKNTILTQQGINNGVTVLKDRIVFNAASEKTSNLFACIYNEGYLPAVQLTFQDSYLQDYSMVEKNGNSWLVAAQADVSIQESAVTDRCTLAWASMQSFQDLALTSVSADQASASAGESYTVTADYKNTGDAVMKNATLSVVNEQNETLAKKTVEFTLNPGEERSTVITVPALTSQETDQKYTLLLSGSQDADESNNRLDYTVGTTDLLLDAQLAMTGNEKRAIIKVSNNSMVPSGGTVIISSDTDDLTAVEIPTLQPNESTIAECVISDDMLKNAKSDVIVATVEAKESEWDDSNNTAYLYTEDYRIDITDADFSLSQSTFTYDGTAKKPTVYVKKNGVKLDKSTDFSVEYKNHTKVGTATVIVTGKGAYKGSVSINYIIRPNATTLTSVSNPSGKNLEIAWNAGEKIDGYEIKYSTQSNFSDATTKVIEDPAETILKLTGRTIGKRYYVRVRTYKTVDDTNYYSLWSEYKSAYIVPPVNIDSLTNTKAGTITVKWTASNYAIDGYELLLATDEAFSKIAKKTDLTPESNTFDFTGRTKGSTYYIRIRTYLNVDDGTKIYSRWSDYQTFKVTK